MSLTLESPLNTVPNLPTRLVKTLEKEGLTRVAEVIAWLPFRHEDRTQDASISFQVSEVPVCHQVLVTKTGTKFFGGRGGM
ncbi:MAG: hypothetical protein ABL974_11830, partial [Prosthecobacter sp.]